MLKHTNKSWACSITHESPAFVKKSQRHLRFSLVLTACKSSNRIDGYLYYRLSTNPTTLDPALIVDVTMDRAAFSPFLYLLIMPAAYVVPEEEINRCEQTFRVIQLERETAS